MFTKSQAHIVLTALLSLLLLTPALSSAGQARAVLLAVTGQVQLVRGQDQLAALSGAPLQAGDKLVSKGGWASLLMADGRVRKLDTGQSLTIMGADKPGGDKLASRLIAAAADTVRLGQTPTAGAVVRGDGRISQTHPRNSAIFAKDLVFQWAGAEKALGVVITVRSQEPAFKYSFRAPANTSQAVYPPDAPPLTPGITYYWKVTAKPTLEGQAQQSNLSWFRILRPSLVQSLSDKKAALAKESQGDIDPRSQKLLSAYLYIANQLYHDAYTMLRRFQRQYPGDQGIKDLLAGCEKWMDGKF